MSECKKVVHYINHRLIFPYLSVNEQHFTQRASLPVTPMFFAFRTPQVKGSIDDGVDKAV